jgi:integrase
MADLSKSTPEAPDLLLPSLTFAEAAPIWYAAHSRHVSAGTRRHYTNCIARLLSFFRETRLDEIRIGQLEHYQKLRTKGEGGLHAAGPSLVNHEMNTLSQILRRVDLWAPIDPHYKTLKLPRPKVGCALSPEDEERLFRVASSNPRWKVAYLCSVLSANTTAGPAEIRHLRLRDVDLAAKPQPTIAIVEGVKNEYRARSIPLNGAAAAAVTELLARARRNGSSQPDHYLLPHRARNGSQGWDPTKPITSWRGAWDKLRETAGLPNLRRYDLRHHAITKLLEDEQISERTVIDLAGHVSRQMLQRYSHIRTKSKVDAVNRLNRGSGTAATEQPFFATSGTVSFVLPASSAPAAPSPAVGATVPKKRVQRRPGDVLIFSPRQTATP